MFSPLSSSDAWRIPPSACPSKPSSKTPFDPSIWVITPGRYRFLVYLISGFFAGLSGALYCFLTQSAFASVLDWTKSGDVVIATLLGGGTVSFYGPIVGTIIFIISQEVISSFWEHWMLLYGLSFVVIILAFPTGLLGMLKKKK